MDFLKDILGEDLFEQLKGKIEAHNGDKKNKDSQVKIGNLATGEYVAKGKYDNLQELLDSSKLSVDELTEKINTMKQGELDSEKLKNKISEIETLLTESKAREDELKLKYALDVAMLAEGISKDNAELLSIALERKLKDKGEVLELDSNGKIKGWSDKIGGLKVQYPSMFNADPGNEPGGKKKVIENKLKKGNPNDDKKDEPKSLAEALQMTYEKNDE